MAEFSCPQVLLFCLPLVPAVVRKRCGAQWSLSPGHYQGNDVVVKLHLTEIVRLRADGDLVLSSGGWRTV